jgi:hypothetical protein
MRIPLIVVRDKTSGYEHIVESELAHNDVRGKKRMLNELLHIINNDCEEV